MELIKKWLKLGFEQYKSLDSAYLYVNTILNNVMKLKDIEYSKVIETISKEAILKFYKDNLIDSKFRITVEMSS